MNCESIQALFDDRLDGRLTPDRSTEFEAHVSTCANCSRHWRAYSATWQVLERHRDVEPSFGFAERTLRRLDETPAPTWSWWPMPARWATLTVAVVALGIAGLTGARRWQADRQAKIYAEMHQADYLEDFDVIEHLDQLGAEDEI